jgi:uncharacterized protein (TIGR02117 family)
VRPSLPALLAAVALAACAGPGAGARLAAPGEGVPVWVLTHAWHTGLAFRLADVAAPLAPMRADFPGAEALEIGWGQEHYWMSPEPTVLDGLRAGLLPSPSAIRVIGFRGAVDRVFVESDVLELRLTRGGLARLVAFFEAAFARDGAGAPIPLGPGPVPGSRYYRGRGRYHALSNSNAWTARALREGGVPLRPALALTASNVLCQLGPRARVLRLRPDTVVHPERGFC